MKRRNGSMLFLSLALIISLLPPYSSGFAEEGGPPSTGGEEAVRGYGDKWAILSKYTGTVTFDGSLDEPVWGQSAGLDDFRQAYTGSPAPHDPHYAIAYSDTHLYIGGMLALEDADDLNKLEIAIAPEASGEAHYVLSVPFYTEGVGLNTDWNPGLALKQPNPQRTDIQTFDYATTVNASAGTLSVEIAVPFSAFGRTSVAAGEEWRMNVLHVYEMNTKPLESWIPVLTARYYDRGRARSFTANVVDHGRLGSLYFSAAAGGEPWEAEDWRLDYTGFSTKTFSFTEPPAAWPHYRLEWKQPTGDWEPLTNVQQTASGSTITLTFQHPDPLRDGIYQLRATGYTTAPGDGGVGIYLFDREDIIAAGLARAPRFQDAGGVTSVTYAPPSAEVQTALQLIPDKSGFRFTGLPERPELTPDGLYTLSPDGQSIISKNTNTAYPNALYPENHALTAIDGQGRTVEYPYYEDEDGKRYFLSAHLWYLQRLSATGKLTAIAPNDPLGAARILYWFAEAYEGYVPTTDNQWYNFPLSLTSGPPFNYWGGRLTRFYGTELGTLKAFLDAYEIVKKTDAFAVLSERIGVDAEKRVLESMFRPTLDYVLSYPVTLGNLDFTHWQGLIAAGKALGEPDYIHRAVELIELHTERNFLSDGFWKEVSLSYHKELSDGLTATLDALKGWSDPEGYISPRTGRHFDNLDLTIDVPITAKAAQIVKQLSYPDGKVVAIGDTWAADSAGAPDLSVGALLLPQAGVAKLTGGTGKEQTQLYMQFTPNYGHNHRSPLNLTLYANHQELLPDLGYTYSQHRSFTLSTIAHNTVVVNGKDSDLEATADGGSIERFVPLSAPFQVMRASEKAYAETDEYSREPWFVPFADGNGGEGYVLDLFRVSGGDRHEYTLQGDANRDALFQTDLALTDYGPYLLPPGTEVYHAQSGYDIGRADGHYYGYIDINDVKRAALTEDRYSVTLVTYDAGEEQGKMKVTGLLEPGQNELYLARSPSIRATRLGGSGQDNNDQASLYDMPKLVLRREGTDLTSTFATVLEPYTSPFGARIDAVDRLQPDVPVEGAAAVRIAYGHTVDILLSNPLHPQNTLHIGDISFQGELGFIRLVDGVVQSMYLIGGTLLQKGERQLTGTGLWTGALSGTLRRANGDPYDALLTSASLPADARDGYVIVTDPDGNKHGYRIGDVVEYQGRTAIVLAEQDPGFVIDGDGSSEWNYFPHTQWSGGTHTFEIAPLFVQDEQTPIALELHASKRDLLVTQSVQLELKGILADGSAADLSKARITYSSSNPSALSVDEKGKVSAVADGGAVIEATVHMHGETKTASLRMFVQAAEAFPLKQPPALESQSGAVFAGEPIRLTFADDSVWRSTVQRVIVNGQTVSPSAYTVSSGGIQFGPGLFDEAGDYWIVAYSEGYRHATAEQTVVSPSALSGLAMTGGTPFPSFSPTTQSYAATVGDDVYGVTLTATAYRPEAAISVNGIVYSSGQPISVPLRDGWNPLQIQVSATGSAAETYSLNVRRPAPERVATGTVTGTVYGPDLLPAGGVWVYVTGEPDHAAVTDESGAFALERVGIGNRRLTVAKPGYARTTSASLAVTAGEAVDVPLRLGGKLPTALMVEGAGRPIAIGETIRATGTADGKAAIVPAATPATRAAIEAAAASANGAWAEAAAEEPVFLSTASLAAGKYSLYAIDAQGNVSPRSDATLIETGAGQLEDNAEVIAYDGSWTAYTSASYSGGQMMMSRTPGSYADIPFYGQRAVLLGTIRSGWGRANVYVDGELKATLDYDNPVILYRQELFDTGWLTRGVHVLRIEATDKEWINLDALRVEASSPPVLLGAGPLASGDPIRALSPVDGGIYLVPAGTAPTYAAIAGAVAENGAYAEATVGQVVYMATTGFAAGPYVLYAIDGEGNVSPPSPQAIVIDPDEAHVEDTDGIVTYAGSWTPYTSTLYSGGQMAMSRTPGSYTDIPFYGQRAVLLGTVKSGWGQAKLYVDGEYRTTVTYDNLTTLYKQTMFDTGPLPPGIHVLRVEAAETKWINVDALEAVN